MSWSEAFEAIVERIRATDSSFIGAIAGDMVGAEEMFALKDLMGRLGVRNIDCRQHGEVFNPTWGRASYVFNPGVAAIDEADAIVLIGTNPRIEAAVLNGRIRKRWRGGGINISVVGEPHELTYPYKFIGSSGPALASMERDGLGDAERPIFIIGPGVYRRPDGEAILSKIARLAKSLGALKTDWNGFAVLHTTAALVAGLDLEFVPKIGALKTSEIVSGAAEVIYNLGADEIEVQSDAFVIYQGTHGDRGAQRADVILPGAAYTEKIATFVNTEGRAQRTSRAVFPPGDAREDWTIIRALSECLNAKLPYDNIQQLRDAMFRAAPVLKDVGMMSCTDNSDIDRLLRLDGKVGIEPLTSIVMDFYLSNPIARASSIMAELSALSQANKTPVAAE